MKRMLLVSAGAGWVLGLALTYAVLVYGSSEWLRLDDARRWAGDLDCAGRCRRQLGRAGKHTRGAAILAQRAPQRRGIDIASYSWSTRWSLASWHSSRSEAPLDLGLTR